jgi:membrane-associated phospholipid phosphatase
MLRRLARVLFPIDLLAAGYAGCLGLLTAAYAIRVPGWPVVVAGSMAIALGLPLLAAARARWNAAPIAFAHDWAFAPLAYATYLLMREVVGPIRGGWVADPILIALDRRALGADAAVLLAPLARPWLTELLQIAYTSFYLLLVAVGAELYAARDRRRFHLYAFACGVGFFASFVGYLVVPAIGPRFTLFDVPTVERELPGLWLTTGLRAFVDGGGLVAPGPSKVAAAAAAPRDVFPSGHTMMTAIAMFSAWRFRLRIRWVVWLVGLLLIAATVYLRYHYAVDVLAGLAAAAACLAVTPPLHRLFAAVCRER